MEKFAQILQFIRVTDSQGNISLTNIALVVALIKVATMPVIALPELAVFLGSIASYQVRRALTMTPVNADEENAAIAASVAKLETKVAAIQLSRQ